MSGGDVAVASGAALKKRVVPGTSSGSKRKRRFPLEGGLGSKRRIDVVLTHGETRQSLGVECASRLRGYIARPAAQRQDDRVGDQITGDGASCHRIGRAPKLPAILRARHWLIVVSSIPERPGSAMITATSHGLLFPADDLTGVHPASECTPGGVWNCRGWCASKSPL